MIEYLEIVNKIKDVKEDAILDFNEFVSIPMILSNSECFIKRNEDKIIIEKNGRNYELTLEQRQSFSEIICLLKKIDKDLYNKIDYKYVDFFEKFKDMNYNFEVDEKLEETNLKKLTLEILTIFNLKFWCIDDVDRKNFLENLKEKKKQVSFVNDEIQSEHITEIIEENYGMIKNTWWLKILNKFRDIKNKLKK